MAAVHPPLLLLLLFLWSSCSAAADTAPMSDAMALLLLKDSFTNASALSSWSPMGSASSPCDPRKPWAGVMCFEGIVTGLRLEGMGLGGTVDIDALVHFSGLRAVSFQRNSLSGPIPDFGRLPALKSLYLSHNHFSGVIPDSFFARMTHLKKLWLSSNAFSGAIPSSLANVTGLIELHLDGNHFSGTIPELKLPLLRSFDVSSNSLEGPIPASLGKFDASSFEDNPGLCGSPQVGGKPCKQPNAVAPAATPLKVMKPDEGEVGKGKLTIVSLLLLAVLLSLLAAALLAVRRRRRARQFDTFAMDHGEADSAMESAEMKRHDSSSSHKQKQKQGSSHKRAGGSSRGAGSGRGGAADLVVVNDEIGKFGLGDLMKAAAEVLGNGGLGSSYKAVMASGVAVVVKRLRELGRAGREAFDADMQRLGRLRHPNVLPPLAYHFRKDEKLIVFEYVPKGSLLYVLHGDRGPEHAALDGRARLKIVRGIARGMAYLHTELANLEVPHGNLKSGNVLLSSDLEPLLVDYGLVALVNPSAAPHALVAYKSPEALQYRHVSPKSDVYCLGIVILEVLSGKFPSQYLNNAQGGTDVAQWATSAVAERREVELLDPEIIADQASVPVMEQLLRVGVACVDPNPDRRPHVRELAMQIEEIAAGTALADEALLSTPSSFVRSLSRSSSNGELSPRRNHEERS